MAENWQGFGTQQDEEEKKKGQAAPEQGFTSGQQVASQTQATLGSGGGTFRQPGTSGGGSGRFTNLQKFLSANKPEKLTSSLQSKFGGEASKTAQAVQSQQEQLSKQIEDQQKLKAQGETFQKVLQGEQVEGGPKSLEELAQGENLSKFQQFAKGEAGLGKLAVDEAMLGKKTSDLQSLAQQASTEKGRFGMLGSMLARPTYSGGQQKLDQLLLQRASGGDVLKQFQQDLASKAQASSKGLEALKGTLGTAQTELGRAGEELAKGLSSKASELTKGFEEKLQSEFKTKEDAQKDLESRAKTQMLSGNIKDADVYDYWVKAAGGRGDIENLNFYDVGEFDSTATPGEGFIDRRNKEREELLSSALKTADPLSLQSLATDEQRSRYKALQALSGKTDTLGLGEKQAEGPKGAMLHEGFFERLKERGQAAEAAKNVLGMDTNKDIGAWNDYGRFDALNQALSAAGVTSGAPVGQLGQTTPGKQVSADFGTGLTKKQLLDIANMSDPADILSTISARPQGPSFSMADPVQPSQISLGQGYKDLLARESELSSKIKEMQSRGITALRPEVGSWGWEAPQTQEGQQRVELARLEDQQRAANQAKSRFQQVTDALRSRAKQTADEYNKQWNRRLQISDAAKQGLSPEAQAILQEKRTKDYRK